MSKNPSIDTLLLDGGCVIFDFINTVSTRVDDNEHEYLSEYQNLIDWCRRLELLPEERLRQLQEYAASYPQRGEESIKRIRAYREMLYRLFSSVAEEKSAAEKDLSEFNELIAESLSKIRFTIKGKKPEAGWECKRVNLYEPLWRVGKSAYQVLTEQPVERIKECEACGWIFLDQSKNRSRRWCNMQTCGSIHKAKKYYHKRKKKKS